MYARLSRRIVLAAASVTGLLAIHGCRPPGPETGSGEGVETSAESAPVTDSGPGTGLAQSVQSVDMGDYEVVLDWPKPLPDDDLSHDGWTWGSGAGVLVESPDKVWVAQRGEIELPPGAEPWICPCLLEPRRTNTGRRAYSGNDYGYEMRRHHIVFAVDREGYAIEEWLQHDEYLAPPRGSGLGEMGRGPHKLLMNPYDPERHIWIVDDDVHQISIFTNDGELVRTIGERGVPGRGPNNFNRPTDIAWLPDGTFFVADREHMRMQVFDENGNFLDMWPTGYDSQVLAHIVTEDDFVWVADWNSGRLVKYDLDGRYMLDIGEPGALPGQFDGVHQIEVDQEGNLYVTEVANDRSQKFRPKPDADPARLIRPMVGRGAQ